MVHHLPTRFTAGRIEVRARRYRDPIARLRYLRRAVGQTAPTGRRAWRIGVAVIFLLLSGGVPLRTVPDQGLPPSESLPGSSPPRVWRVEETGSAELFSNGLRIENRYAIPTKPRAYRVWDRLRDFEPGPAWNTEPAGIVYHTTESYIVPFHEEQNRNLRRAGHALLEYVRLNQSYHFVIDRFGRVWRVVEETDVAHHAGYSVWGDERRVWVNLNCSFLGVAFEAQTLGERSLPSVTPAQLHAAKLLTALLRFKYGIDSRNCVTHAQVSVNPRNMRAGYHTDWAANFPFRELGLEDNYQTPTASLFAFGFDCDPALLSNAGAGLRLGFLAAEAILEREATARRIPLGTYKSALRERYRTLMAALKDDESGPEAGQESGAF